MLVLDGGRRNLSDGWRYKLESSKKDILSEIGREKISAAVAIANSIAPKTPSSTLSTIDKVESEPQAALPSPEIIETIEGARK